MKRCTACGLANDDARSKCWSCDSLLPALEAAAASGAQRTVPLKDPGLGAALAVPFFALGLIYAEDWARFIRYFFGGLLLAGFYLVFVAVRAPAMAVILALAGVAFWIAAIVASYNACVRFNDRLTIDSGKPSSTTPP